MSTRKIDIITMGCSKNLVDSEQLMRRIEAKGYTVEHNSHNVDGDIVIVNTCGFIGDAKEESVNMILDLCNLKQEGVISKIIVMGCLSQRYLSELTEEIPEVDAWYGKFNWNEIIDTLPAITTSSQKKPFLWERKLTTAPWTSYMKISEGCDRFCAYCAIPLITGRHKSRPIDDIISETRHLTQQGVKEFNVIAQDLSAYGKDLYGRLALPELIDRMADVEGVEWIRLHYAYPVEFPMEVLNVMQSRDNVCHYLDMALQHISNPVLANMRRHITADQTYALIEKIRSSVPDIRLRTTLMTGFPGEGEKEFKELLEFVEKVKFDRMGAFAYSEEEGTWGARHLGDDIPEEVKQQRLEQLMELQEGISASLHEKLIGTTQRVLVDEKEDSTLTGRTQWDSPEVDPVVIIHTPRDMQEPQPGSFVNVKITAAEAFELQGEITR